MSVGVIAAIMESVLWSNVVTKEPNTTNQFIDQLL